MYRGELYRYDRANYITSEPQYYRTVRFTIIIILMYTTTWDLLNCHIDKWKKWPLMSWWLRIVNGSLTLEKYCLYKVIISCSKCVFLTLNNRCYTDIRKLLLFYSLLYFSCKGFIPYKVLILSTQIELYPELIISHTLNLIISIKKRLTYYL